MPISKFIEYLVQQITMIKLKRGNSNQNFDHLNKSFKLNLHRVF